MRHVRGLRVEAAGRQGLEIGGVELLTIAGRVSPGEYRDLTCVRMRVGRNAETLRETKANGVRPWFGRIANEVKLLQAWCRQPALRLPFHLVRCQGNDPWRAVLCHCD